tara:strand:- start:2163 stop:2423 length:261 start_codon:yes stop_codon:yes gene_type:complete
MYKKALISFLIFLAPIAWIEQNKKEKYYQTKTKQLEMTEKNNHNLVDLLFEPNKETSIEVKDCWEEGDLASQKRYCSSEKKYFHIF